MRMAKFKTQHELKRILSMILAMCFVIVTVITDTSMTAKAADNTWSFFSKNDVLRHLWNNDFVTNSKLL